MTDWMGTANEWASAKACRASKGMQGKQGFKPLFREPTLTPE